MRLRLRLRLRRVVVRVGVVARLLVMVHDGSAVRDVGASLLRVLLRVLLLHELLGVGVFAPSRSRARSQWVLVGHSALPVIEVPVGARRHSHSACCQ